MKDVVVEYEVYCHDECVAMTFGPKDKALSEARRYAGVYASDGPIKIYEVHKTFTLVGGGT